MTLNQHSIDRADSQLISVIRIVMILALVVHHIFTLPNSGYFPRLALTDEFTSLPNLINGLLHWSAMSAVPLLSLISGILFFGSKKTLIRKLRGRTFSIVIPCAIWGVLWLTVAFTLHLIGRDRGILEWANYHFDNPTLLHMLNGAFGITEIPFAFQFWFTRDLILTLAISPLIVSLLHKLPHLTIAVLSGIWLSQINLIIFFSPNVLFFFCLGGYLQLQGIKLSHARRIPQKTGLTLVGLFIFSVTGRVFQHWHPILASEQFLCALRLLGCMTWLLAIIYLTDHCHRLAQRLKHWSQYSFFIFAAHYPSIEFIKIAAQYVPGQASTTGQILSILIIPGLTIILCLIAAKTFQKRVPLGYRWLSGGR